MTENLVRMPKRLRAVATLGPAGRAGSAGPSLHCATGSRGEWMSAGWRENAWRVAVSVTTLAVIGLPACGGENAKEPSVSSGSPVAPAHQGGEVSRGGAREGSESESSRENGGSSRKSGGDGRTRRREGVERGRRARENVRESATAAVPRGPAGLAARALASVAPRSRRGRLRRTTGASVATTSRPGTRRGWASAFPTSARSAGARIGWPQVGRLAHAFSA